MYRKLDCRPDGPSLPIGPAGLPELPERVGGRPGWRSTSSASLAASNVDLPRYVLERNNV